MKQQSSIISTVHKATFILAAMLMVILSPAWAGTSNNASAAPASQSALFDWGDAPDSYGTNATDSNGEGVGPSHEIDSSLGLGVSIDAETEGQPSANADGDDTNGSPNDEDGLLPFNSPMGVCSKGNRFWFNYHNDTGSDAYIYAWFDLNSDGVFHPTDELITDALPAPDDDNVGTNIRSDRFNIPCDVTPTLATHLRIRIDTASTGILPTGSGGIGEVEDYTYELFGWDFGDANNIEFMGFQTTWVPAHDNLYNSGVAHHGITDATRLGSCVDMETNGQSTATTLPIEAHGDDENSTAVSLYSPACEDGDDEDGLENVEISLSENAGMITATAELTITTNGITDNACVWGWVDWQLNGFSVGPTNPDTNLTGTGVDITSADNGIPFVMTIEHTMPSNTFQFDQIIPIRLRIVSDDGRDGCDKMGPTETRLSGEVEDYVFSLNHDWGDLPDSYNTLSTNNGASHLLSGSYMGSCVDAETSGSNTPPTDAIGDDIATSSTLTVGSCAEGSDEDGVTVPTITNDQPRGDWSDGSGHLDVVVTADACVNIWLDYNNDGSFNYTPGTTGVQDDWVVENTPVSATSVNKLDFSLPLDIANNAQLYYRVRLTSRDSAGGCDPSGAYNGNATHDGPAWSGEVEDYQTPPFSPTAIGLNGFSTSLPTGDLIWITVSSIFLLLSSFVAMKKGSLLNKQEVSTE